MNFKYLQKIPVVHPNIFSRQFEINLHARNSKDISSPLAVLTHNRSHDKEKCRSKYATAATMPNLLAHDNLKKRALPNVGMWDIRRNNSDSYILKRYHAKTSNSGSNVSLKRIRSTATFKTSLKYRKYMQTRNYSSLIDKIMKFLNSLKGNPQETSRTEVKTHDNAPKPLETIEFQTAVQGKAVKVQKDFKDQIKDMKEFSEEFEVENQDKSVKGEGKFVEDRLCEETPAKEIEKFAKDKAEEVKAKKRRVVKCEKDDTFAGCKLDDTYSGVAPDDDNIIISTSQCAHGSTRAKKSKCNAEYVADDAACKGDVSEEVVNKKTKQCFQTIKVDVTPKKCKKAPPPVDKQRKKTLVQAKSASKCHKRDRHFKKIDGDFAIGYSPSYDFSRLLDEAMRIKRDPNVAVEKKDPRVAVEFKDPERNHRLIERPTNDEIREPIEVFEVLANEDSKEGCEYTKFPQERKPKCKKKKKEGGKECEKAEVKREEKECPPVKVACPPKKEKICEGAEGNVTDPCKSQSQTCCYNKKEKMPVVQCTICKKFEILDIPPKPKPKSSPCKARKCGKQPRKCADAKAPPPNCCKPLPKRPPLCPKCPKPKFPVEAKPDHPSSSSTKQKKCELKMPCCRPLCVKSAPPKQPEPEPVEAAKTPKAHKSPKSTKSKKDLEKEKIKLAKMCKKKKKKSSECSVDTCKTKDACVKRKEKKAKHQAEKDKPAPKKDSCKVGVHTDWKPVAISSGKKKCKPIPPESSNVRPKVDQKYQSPRFDKKKGKCDNGNKGKLAYRNSVHELRCPGWNDAYECEFVKTRRIQSSPMICLPYQISDRRDDDGDEEITTKKPYAFYMDADFRDRSKERLNRQR